MTYPLHGSELTQWILMMATMARVSAEGMTGCAEKDTTISTLESTKEGDIPKLHPKHPSSQGTHSPRSGSWTSPIQ